MTELPVEVRARTQCRDKCRYPSEAKALRGAERSADRWNCAVFVYECDACGFWHVATSNKAPGGGFPKPTAVVVPKERPQC